MCVTGRILSKNLGAGHGVIEKRIKMNSGLLYSPTTTILWTITSLRVARLVIQNNKSEFQFVWEIVNCCI